MWGNWETKVGIWVGVGKPRWGFGWELVETEVLLLSVTSQSFPNHAPYPSFRVIMRLRCVMRAAHNAT
jgi:hypothetical protein